MKLLFSFTDEKTNENIDKDLINLENLLKLINNYYNYKDKEIIKIQVCDSYLRVFTKSYLWFENRSIINYYELTSLIHLELIIENNDLEFNYSEKPYLTKNNGIPKINHIFNMSVKNKSTNEEIIYTEKCKFTLFFRLFTLFFKYKNDLIKNVGVINE